MNTKLRPQLRSIATLLTGMACLALVSCSGPEKPEVPQGVLTYAIDYPDHKDQLFLYGLLPKEMTLSYKGPVMEIKVSKSNMENTLLVDNQKKRILAYFKYDSPINTTLSPADIQAFFEQDPAYEIRYTDEQQKIIGFNAQKAIATNPKDTTEKVEVWYTREIPSVHQQWFGPYRDIQATILSYTLTNHGMRMVFTAKQYEEVPVSDSIVTFERPGRKISYTEYDRHLSELFESFQ